MVAISGDYRGIYKINNLILETVFEKGEIVASVIELLLKCDSM